MKLYIGLERMTTYFRKERHSVTDIKIHLVCVTKYRRSVFNAESLGVIEKSFRLRSRKDGLPEP